MAKYGPKSVRGGKGVRGNTGGGGGNTGHINMLPLAGQTAFFDGGKTDQMRTVESWEDKRKTLDHEQLLLTNADGYAVGYFDGDRDSVAFAIPREYRDEASRKSLVLTHVHPPYYDRTIGGGFSDADVLNHIRLGLGETRAVSAEGVYSFKTTRESDPTGFVKALNDRSSAVSWMMNEAEKALKAQGITLDGKDHTDFYLRVSDAWYRQTAYKYGYEYRSPWG